MKKIAIITVILIATSTYLVAEENCKNLPGFKTLGKDTPEYLKCLNPKNKQSYKLKLDSKLTRVSKGEEKLNIPNPLNALVNFGKAIKPDKNPLQKK